MSRGDFAIGAGNKNAKTKEKLFLAFRPNGRKTTDEIHARIHVEQ